VRTQNSVKKIWPG